MHRAPYLLLAMASVAIASVPDNGATVHGTSNPSTTYGLDDPIIHRPPPLALRSYVPDGIGWDPVAAMAQVRKNRNKARSRKRPGSSPRHRRSSHKPRRVYPV